MSRCSGGGGGLSQSSAGSAGGLSQGGGSSRKGGGSAAGGMLSHGTSNSCRDRQQMDMGSARGSIQACRHQEQPLDCACSCSAVQSLAVGVTQRTATGDSCTWRARCCWLSSLGAVVVAAGEVGCHRGPRLGAACRASFCPWEMVLMGYPVAAAGPCGWLSQREKPIVICAPSDMCT
jgi:hypothetical protein